MENSELNRMHGTESTARPQLLNGFAANSMPPYGTAAVNGAAYRFASPYNYAPLPTTPGSGSMQQHQRYSRRAHSESTFTQSQSQSQSERAYGGLARIEFDDNWGDNTTAITGATSETGVSVMNDEFAAIANSMYMRANPHLLPRMDKQNPNAAVVVTSDSEMPSDGGCDCAHTLSLGASYMLAVLALLSPIVMLVLPKCGLNDWQVTISSCDVTCEAPLLSFTSKLLILAIGSWALFLRRSRCSLPRLRIFRALLGFLLLILLSAFWLYYGLRILNRRESNYGVIVDFASSFVDVLVIVHYLAVVLIEVRAISTRFAVKVVRAPDGVTQVYPIGMLSVQHAAVYVLDRYAVDFEQHNPFVEAAIRRHASLNAGGRSSASRAARRAQSASRNGGVEFKLYEIDGVTNANTGERQPQFDFDACVAPSEPASFVPASSLQQQFCAGQGSTGNRKPTEANSNALFSSTSANAPANGLAPLPDTAAQPTTPTSGRYRRRMDRDVMRNDRFYAELEYERRLRRRRARLVSAVEGAFAHVHRISADRGLLTPPLEASEAAQAVFPSIARPLQKYLRVTRQQLKYSMETIVAHLTLCLTYDLGPRVFLERFLTQGSVLQVNSGITNGRRSRTSHLTWTILADTGVLNRAVDDGTVFILKQHDVTLLCTVHKLPFYALSEEIIDAKSNKFVFKINSETSV